MVRKTKFRGRFSSSARRAALVLGVATAGSLGLAGSAFAVSQPIGPWTLHSNTVSTYGNYNSSGRGEGVNYRWTVDTAHSTRVSMNLCSNYGVYSSVDIDAHIQSYKVVGYFGANQCLALRGRSLFGGQGSLYGNLLY